MKQFMIKKPIVGYIIRTLFAVTILTGLTLPFTGCVTLTSKPSICEGVTDSLICDRIPNPQLTDILLQVGSLELIENGTYSKAEVMEFLDDVEQFVMNATTYSGIVRFVMARLKTVPPKLMVLSQAMISFEDVLVPITATDRGFILASIEHIRTAMAFAK